MIISFFIHFVQGYRSFQMIHGFFIAEQLNLRQCQIRIDRCHLCPGTLILTGNRECPLQTVTGTFIVPCLLEKKTHALIQLYISEIIISYASLVNSFDLLIGSHGIRKKSCLSVCICYMKKRSCIRNCPFHSHSLQKQENLLTVFHQLFKFSCSSIIADQFIHQRDHCTSVTFLSCLFHFFS